MKRQFALTLALTAATAAVGVVAACAGPAGVRPREKKAHSSGPDAPQGRPEKSSTGPGIKKGKDGCTVDLDAAFAASDSLSFTGADCPTVTLVGSGAAIPPGKTLALYGVKEFLLGGAPLTGEGKLVLEGDAGSPLVVRAKDPATAAQTGLALVGESALTRVTLSGVGVVSLGADGRDPAKAVWRSVEIGARDGVAPAVAFYGPAALPCDDAKNQAFVTGRTYDLADVKVSAAAGDHVTVSNAAPVLSGLQFPLKEAQPAAYVDVPVLCAPAGATVRLPDRGLPYAFGHVEVTGNLKIDAGVSARFGEDGGILVKSGGHLQTLGSGDARVDLGAATNPPASGHAWQGVTVEGGGNASIGGTTITGSGVKVKGGGKSQVVGGSSVSGTTCAKPKAADCPNEGAITVEPKGEVKLGSDTTVTPAEGGKGVTSQGQGEDKGQVTTEGSSTQVIPNISAEDPGYQDNVITYQPMRPFWLRFWFQPRIPDYYKWEWHQGFIALPNALKTDFDALNHTFKSECIDVPRTEVADDGTIVVTNEIVSSLEITIKLSYEAAPASFTPPFPLGAGLTAGQYTGVAGTSVTKEIQQYTQGGCKKDTASNAPVIQTMTGWYDPYLAMPAKDVKSLRNLETKTFDFVSLNFGGHWQVAPQIDFIYEHITVTPTTQQMVDHYNETKYCEYADWQVNQPKEITLKHCVSDNYVIDPFIDRNLMVTTDAGQTFKLGQDWSLRDPDAAEHRMLAPHDIVYTKQ